MRYENCLNESDDKDIKERWSKYIKSDKMIKNGVDILKIIEKHGGKAWIVGGAVRDLIMGVKPHDIDITTDLSMDKLDKIFKTYDVGRGRDLGIVVVNHGGEQFEIAQLRGENYMKPKTVRKIIND